MKKSLLIIAAVLLGTLCLIAQSNNWEIAAVWRALSWFEAAEVSAPSGLAGSGRLWADSGDHFLKYNPNNQGEQHISQAFVLHGSYSNATTTFSTITDGTRNMQFPVAANKDYAVDCTFVGQGSVTTAGPKFQLTGPSTPTLVKLMVDGGTNAAAYADGVATGFSSANTTLGTLGAGTTDFIWHVNASIANGVNAGTVVLQAAANGAGTLTEHAGGSQRWSWHLLESAARQTPSG